MSNEAGDKPDMRVVWKEFNNIGKGKKENNPTAKYNHKGKLVTTEEDILEAERKEIEEKTKKKTNER